MTKRVPALKEIKRYVQQVQQLVGHLLGRSLLGRYGIAGEKNAVDIK